MDPLDDGMIVFGRKVIHNRTNVGLKSRSILEAGFKVVLVIVPCEAIDEASKEISDLCSV